MDTARKRIIYFIEKNCIRPNDFLRKTGLKKGFIDKSHQESGVSDLFLSKILETYPNINAEWLLTGRGNMLRSSLSSSEARSNIDSRTSANEVIAIYKGLLTERDMKIDELNREIGRLEERIKGFQGLVGLASQNYHAEDSPVSMELNSEI